MASDAMLRRSPGAPLSSPSGSDGSETSYGSSGEDGWTLKGRSAPKRTGRRTRMRPNSVDSNLNCSQRSSGFGDFCPGDPQEGGETVAKGPFKKNVTKNSNVLTDTSGVSQEGVIPAGAVGGSPRGKSAKRSPSSSTASKSDDDGQVVITVSATYDGVKHTVNYIKPDILRKVDAKPIFRSKIIDGSDCYLDGGSYYWKGSTVIEGSMLINLSKIAAKSTLYIIMGEANFGDAKQVVSAPVGLPSKITKNFFFIGDDSFTFGKNSVIGYKGRIKVQDGCIWYTPVKGAKNIFTESNFTAPDFKTSFIEIDDPNLLNQRILQNTSVCFFLNSNHFEAALLAAYHGTTSTFTYNKPGFKGSFYPSTEGQYINVLPGDVNEVKKLMPRIKVSANDGGVSYNEVAKLLGKQKIDRIVIKHYKDGKSQDGLYPGRGYYFYKDGTYHINIRSQSRVQDISSLLGAYVNIRHANKHNVVHFENLFDPVDSYSIIAVLSMFHRDHGYIVTLGDSGAPPDSEYDNNIAFPIIEDLNFEASLARKLFGYHDNFIYNDAKGSYYQGLHKPIYFTSDSYCVVRYNELYYNVSDFTPFSVTVSCDGKEDFLELYNLKQFRKHWVKTLPMDSIQEVDEVTNTSSEVLVESSEELAVLPEEPIPCQQDVEDCGDHAASETTSPVPDNRSWSDEAEADPGFYFRDNDDDIIGAELLDTECDGYLENHVVSEDDIQDAEATWIAAASEDSDTHDAEAVTDISATSDVAVDFFTNCLTKDDDNLFDVSSHLNNELHQEEPATNIEVEEEEEEEEVEDVEPIPTKEFVINQYSVSEYEFIRERLSTLSCEHSFAHANSLTSDVPDFDECEVHEVSSYNEYFLFLIDMHPIDFAVPGVHRYSDDLAVPGVPRYSNDYVDMHLIDFAVPGVHRYSITYDGISAKEANELHQQLVSSAGDIFTIGNIHCKSDFTVVVNGITTVFAANRLVNKRFVRDCIIARHVVNYDDNRHRPTAFKIFTFHDFNNIVINNYRDSLNDIGAMVVTDAQHIVVDYAVTRTNVAYPYSAQNVVNITFVEEFILNRGRVDYNCDLHSPFGGNLFDDPEIGFNPHINGYEVNDNFIEFDYASYVRGARKHGFPASMSTVDFMPDYADLSNYVNSVEKEELPHEGTYDNLPDDRIDLIDLLLKFGDNWYLDADFYHYHKCIFGAVADLNNIHIIICDAKYGIVNVNISINGHKISVPISKSENCMVLYNKVSSVYSGKFVLKYSHLGEVTRIGRFSANTFLEGEDIEVLAIGGFDQSKFALSGCTALAPEPVVVSVRPKTKSVLESVPPPVPSRDLKPTLHVTHEIVKVHAKRVTHGTIDANDTHVTHETVEVDDTHVTVPESTLSCDDIEGTISLTASGPVSEEPICSIISTSSPVTHVEVDASKCSIYDFVTCSYKLYKSGIIPNKFNKGHIVPIEHVQCELQDGVGIQDVTVSDDWTSVNDLKKDGLYCYFPPEYIKLRRYFGIYSGFVYNTSSCISELVEPVKKLIEPFCNKFRNSRAFSGIRYCRDSFKNMSPNASAKLDDLVSWINSSKATVEKSWASINDPRPIAARFNLQIDWSKHNDKTVRGLSFLLPLICIIISTYFHFSGKVIDPRVKDISTIFVHDGVGHFSTNVAAYILVMIVTIFIPIDLNDLTLIYTMGLLISIGSWGISNFLLGHILAIILHSSKLIKPQCGLATKPLITISLVVFSTMIYFTSSKHHFYQVFIHVITSWFWCYLPSFVQILSCLACLNQFNYLRNTYYYYVKDVYKSLGLYGTVNMLIPALLAVLIFIVRFCKKCRRHHGGTCDRPKGLIDIPWLFGVKSMCKVCLVAPPKGVKASLHEDSTDRNGKRVVYITKDQLDKLPSVPGCYYSCAVKLRDDFIVDASECYEDFDTTVGDKVTNWRVLTSNAGVFEINDADGTHNSDDIVNDIKLSNALGSNIISIRSDANSPILENYAAKYNAHIRVFHVAGSIVKEVGSDHTLYYLIICLVNCAYYMFNYKFRYIELRYYSIFMTTLMCLPLIADTLVKRDWFKGLVKLLYVDASVLHLACAFIGVVEKYYKFNLYPIVYIGVISFTFYTYNKKVSSTAVSIIAFLLVACLPAIIAVPATIVVSIYYLQVLYLLPLLFFLQAKMTFGVMLAMFAYIYLGRDFDSRSLVYLFLDIFMLPFNFICMGSLLICLIWCFIAKRMNIIPHFVLFNILYLLKYICDVDLAVSISRVLPYSVGTEMLIFSYLLIIFLVVCGFKQMREAIMNMRVWDLLYMLAGLVACQAFNIYTSLAGVNFITSFLNLLPDVTYYSGNFFAYYTNENCDYDEKVDQEFNFKDCKIKYFAKGLKGKIPKTLPRSKIVIFFNILLLICIVALATFFMIPYVGVKVDRESPNPLKGDIKSHLNGFDDIINGYIGTDVSSDDKVLAELGIDFSDFSAGEHDYSFVTGSIVNDPGIHSDIYYIGPQAFVSYSANGVNCTYTLEYSDGIRWISNARCAIKPGYNVPVRRRFTSGGIFPGDNWLCAHSRLTDGHMLARMLGGYTYYYNCYPQTMYSNSLQVEIENKAKSLLAAGKAITYKVSTTSYRGKYLVVGDDETARRCVYPGIKKVKFSGNFDDYRNLDYPVFVIADEAVIDSNLDKLIGWDRDCDTPVKIEIVGYDTWEYIPGVRDGSKPNPVSPSDIHCPQSILLIARTAIYNSPFNDYILATHMNQFVDMVCKMVYAGSVGVPINLVIDPDNTLYADVIIYLVKHFNNFFRKDYIHYKLSFSDGVNHILAQFRKERCPCQPYQQTFSVNYAKSSGLYCHGSSDFAYQLANTWGKCVRHLDSKCVINTDDIAVDVREHQGDCIDGPMLTWVDRAYSDDGFNTIPSPIAQSTKYSGYALEIYTPKFSVRHITDDKCTLSFGLPVKFYRDGKFIMSCGRDYLHYMPINNTNFDVSAKLWNTSVIVPSIEIPPEFIEYGSGGCNYHPVFAYLPHYPKYIHSIEDKCLHDWVFKHCNGVWPDIAEQVDISTNIIGLCHILDITHDTARYSGQPRASKPTIDPYIDIEGVYPGGTIADIFVAGIVSGHFIIPIRNTIFDHPYSANFLGVPTIIDGDRYEFLRSYYEDFGAGYNDDGTKIVATDNQYVYNSLVRDYSDYWLLPDAKPVIKGFGEELNLTISTNCSTLLNISGSTADFCKSAKWIYGPAYEYVRDIGLYYGIEHVYVPIPYISNYVGHGNHNITGYDVIDAHILLGRDVRIYTPSAEIPLIAIKHFKYPVFEYCVHTDVISCSDLGNPVETLFGVTILHSNFDVNSEFDEFSMQFDYYTLDGSVAYGKGHYAYYLYRFKLLLYVCYTILCNYLSILYTISCMDFSKFVAMVTIITTVMYAAYVRCNMLLLAFASTDFVKMGINMLPVSKEFYAIYNCMIIPFSVWQFTYAFRSSDVYSFFRKIYATVLLISYLPIGQLNLKLVIVAIGFVGAMLQIWESLTIREWHYSKFYSLSEVNKLYTKYLSSIITSGTSKDEVEKLLFARQLKDKDVDKCNFLRFLYNAKVNQTTLHYKAPVEHENACARFYVRVSNYITSTLYNMYYALSSQNGKHVLESATANNISIVPPAWSSLVTDDILEHDDSGGRCVKIRTTRGTIYVRHNFSSNGYDALGNFNRTFPNGTKFGDVFLNADLTGKLDMATPPHGLSTAYMYNYHDRSWYKGNITHQGVHDFSTYCGLSGSPIFILVNEQPKVAAIHVCSLSDYNGALVFKDDVSGFVETPYVVEYGPKDDNFITPIEPKHAAVILFKNYPCVYMMDPNLIPAHKWAWVGLNGSQTSLHNVIASKLAYLLFTHSRKSIRGKLSDVNTHDKDWDKYYGQLVDYIHPGTIVDAMRVAFNGDIKTLYTFTNSVFSRKLFIILLWIMFNLVFRTVVVYYLKYIFQGSTQHYMLIALSSFFIPEWYTVLCTAAIPILVAYSVDILIYIFIFNTLISVIYLLYSHYRVVIDYGYNRRSLINSSVDTLIMAILWLSICYINVAHPSVYIEMGAISLGVLTIALKHGSGPSVFTCLESNVDISGVYTNCIKACAKSLRTVAGALKEHEFNSFLDSMANLLPGADIGQLEKYSEDLYNIYVQLHSDDLEGAKADDDVLAMLLAKNHEDALSVFSSYFADYELNEAIGRITKLLSVHKDSWTDIDKKTYNINKSALENILAKLNRTRNIRRANDQEEQAKKNRAIKKLLKSENTQYTSLARHANVISGASRLLAQFPVLFDLGITTPSTSYDQFRQDIKVLKQKLFSSTRDGIIVSSEGLSWDNHFRITTAGPYFGYYIYSRICNGYGYKPSINMVGQLYLLQQLPPCFRCGCGRSEEVDSHNIDTKLAKHVSCPLYKPTCGTTIYSMLDFIEHSTVCGVCNFCTGCKVKPCYSEHCGSDFTPESAYDNANRKHITLESYASRWHSDGIKEVPIPSADNVLLVSGGSVIASRKPYTTDGIDFVVCTVTIGGVEYKYYKHPTRYVADPLKLINAFSKDDLESCIKFRHVDGNWYFGDELVAKDVETDVFRNKVAIKDGCVYVKDNPEFTPCLVPSSYSISSSIVVDPVLVKKASGKNLSVETRPILCTIGNLVDDHLSTFDGYNVVDLNNNQKRVYIPYCIANPLMTALSYYGFPAVLSSESCVDGRAQNNYFLDLSRAT